MVENIEVLQDLCKKVGVEYSTTIWSVEQFIDFSRKCYEQGRADEREQTKSIEKENEGLKEKIKKLESDLSWSRDNNQMGRW